jgi:mannose-6-phosphate isomerase-like protein (cupin superfamily)
MLTQYENIEPFTTKDGSQIRELMHPRSHDVVKQSLAEATVPEGGETLLHKHSQTEELYHITQGQGMMRLGEETFAVKAGDTICIAPGTAHNICNTGDEALKILCSCSPPYRDDDTILIES